MTAFVRAEMFKEVELLESLEAKFIERVDTADGATLVTMFNAHCHWANHIVDETLIKKNQARRVYKVFKKYNDSFYEHVAVNLTRNSEDINLKGSMLVLCNGNVSHLKKRDNIRIMRQFAFKQIIALKRER